MWKLFRTAELDEVMRQKGDNDLINMLNKVVQTGDNDSERLIISGFIYKNDPSFPEEALHIFAENKPAQCHNDDMLNHLCHSLLEVAAIDEMPQNISQSDISKAFNRKQSETGGLARILRLKLEARVMLTCNIDIEDRLINGKIRTVRHITAKNNGYVQKKFIELDGLVSHDYLQPTIVDKNVGTNDKFYWKVAFLMYTEMFNFRSQSRKAASKPKPHRGLGTR